MKTRRQSGKIGPTLYAIVNWKGELQSICYTKAEVDYVMRMNNGKQGRHWLVMHYDKRPT